jgi:hypothetical protein
MSGILLRDQRVTAIAALAAAGIVYPGTSYAIPVKRVEAHGGEMTDEQRTEFFTDPPVVLVACIGTSPVDYAEEQEAGGRLQPRYVMSVVVFGVDLNTPSNGRLHRSDVAQCIAEAIAADVFYNRTDASASEASRFRMDNAWLSVGDRQDVGMWVMTWEEGAEIANVDPATLPDLVTVRTDYEIADTIDAPQMLGRVVYPSPQIDDPDLP